MFRGAGDIPATTGQIRNGQASAAGLRVALFSGNYNCVRDGANNALNHLGHYLLDHGAALRVYAPTVPVPAFPPAGDLVPLPSVPIPRRHEYRLAIGLNDAIREDIRRFAPTILHLSAPDIAAWQAQHLAREMGRPVVASLHTRFETYLRYYGLGLFREPLEHYLHRFYAGCDIVLAPNERIAETVRSWGVPGEVRIWSRGVDRTQFLPARRDMAWRRAQGYADGEAVLLFFGRLVAEKGLAAFAGIIARLRARGHAVRPLVVGSGPAKQTFANELGDAVFTGNLSGPDLARAVASADILINPSTTDAFGNVTLEAMASGLAVICADVPSASTLITDRRTGRLVPERDLPAYVAAVEELIRHPLTRRALAANAVRRAADFDWSTVLGSVVDAYRDAISLSSGRAAIATAAGL